MKKLLLSLAALFTLGGMLQAETLTLDLTTDEAYGMTASEDYETNPYTLTDTDPLTVTLAGKTRYYSGVNGNDLRFYKNSDASMTITAPDSYYIVRVEFTGNAANDFKVGDEAVSATWTGKANSVKFDYANTSKNNGLTMVVIYYNNTGEQPEPEPEPEPDDSYATLTEWLTAMPAEPCAIESTVTAVYQQGNDLYITDGQSYTMVRGALGQTYTNGMVIPAGIQGTYNVYQGTPQMVPVASTFKAGEAGNPVPAKAYTIAELENSDLINHYVRIEGVTLTADESSERKFWAELDGDQICVWNRWNYSVDITTGADATVYGFLAYYQNDEESYFQIYATDVEVEGEPEGPVTGNATFNFNAPSTLSPAQETPTAGADGAIDVDGLTFTAGDVTFCTVIGTNTVGPRIYKNGDYDPHLRVYQGNLSTFEALNGATITRICFNMIYDSEGCVEKIDEGGDISEVTYGTKLVEWNGSTQKIVFHWQKYTNGTSSYSPNINSIVVTYTTGAGIEEVITLDPNAPVEYYNLQGIRINNPAAGQIVIRRQGNVVDKVRF